MAPQYQLPPKKKVMPTTSYSTPPRAPMLGGAPVAAAKAPEANKPDFASLAQKRVAASAAPAGAPGKNGGFEVPVTPPDERKPGGGFQVPAGATPAKPTGMVIESASARAVSPGERGTAQPLPRGPVDVTAQYEKDYGTQAEQQAKQNAALAAQQADQDTEWEQVAEYEWEAMERNGGAPAGVDADAWKSAYTKYDFFRNLTPDEQAQFLAKEMADFAGEASGPPPASETNTTPVRPPTTWEQQLDTETMNALAGTGDYGYTDEQLAALKQEIGKQAETAKYGVSQSMAARGLGSSGMTGAALGNVDAAAMGEWADLVASDQQMGIDERLNILKTTLTSQAQMMSEEVRKQIADRVQQLEEDKFGFEKGQTAEGDQWTELANALALLGSEEYASEALAWALEQQEAGVPFSEIVAKLDEDTNGELNALLPGEGGVEPKNPITESVSKGGDEYGKPPSYGLDYSAFQKAAAALNDGTDKSYVTADYNTTSSGYRNLYDQYVADSTAGGFPPLDYRLWLSYIETSIGTPNPIAGTWISDEV